MSLSFLDGQGEEKRGEAEENSLLLNYIYIWFSDIGGFLGPPGSDILEGGFLVFAVDNNLLRSLIS